MKVKYDQEVDVLRIRFSSAAVDESDEEKPGIILDYDGAGRRHIFDSRAPQLPVKPLQELIVQKRNAAHCRRWA